MGALVETPSWHQQGPIQFPPREHEKYVVIIGIIQLHIYFKKLDCITIVQLINDVSNKIIWVNTVEDL